MKGEADTPTKMRRKGSFLRRHFANPRGPMVDEKGKPTSLALSAHAWGEPVPKTMAAAKKLAEKGSRLLERYARTKQSKERSMASTTEAKAKAKKSKTKRPSTKKPAAKRSTAKRATSKRSTAKKSPSTRAVAKKPAANRSSAKKATAKKRPSAKAKRRAGEKNSLVANINARKRDHTSRPKSRSTVSKKSYRGLKEGWPES